MTVIGTFTTTRDGFCVRLPRLTIDRALTIMAAGHAGADRAPDDRILARKGAAMNEGGAGWKRTGHKADALAAVRIDALALRQPLRANLLRADSQTHGLMGPRRARRGAKD